MDDISNLKAALIDSQSLTQKIEEALVNSGGEITEVISDLLAFKDYSAKALEDSVDVVAQTVERLELLQEYYDQQIIALEKIRNGISRSKDDLKFNLKSRMELFDLIELNGAIKRIFLAKTAPKVDVLDQSLVPEEFKKVVLSETIEKSKISAFIKEGGTVPGCRLINGSSMRITKAKPQIKGEI